MLDWRPLAYGVITFLLLLVVTLRFESDPMILLLGFPCGLVAGYRAGGILRGVLHGCVTGCCIATIFFGGGYYLITLGPATPSVGLSLFVLFLFAVLLVVESTIAGAIGGLLGRYSSILP